MDKLVRKIEIPLARNAIEKAGLYIVQKKDLDRLADVAADAYKDYPLHNWLTNGKYDAKNINAVINAKTAINKIIEPFKPSITNSIPYGGFHPPSQ